MRKMKKFAALIAVAILAGTLTAPVSVNADASPVATGETLSNFGWTFTPHATDPSSAEIVREADGNRMLHVKYTASAWSPILLNRTIATPAGAGGIDWNAYKIYFKIKGTYNEGAIEIGCDNIDGYLRYLNNETYVTKKALGDGWTQYAVRTSGKNASGFRIKIRTTIDAYLDDFMVVKLNSQGNTDGTEIYGDHLYNGSFDNKTAVASTNCEGWTTAFGANNSDTTYMATVDTTHSYSGQYSYFISGPKGYVSGVNADARGTLLSSIDYSKSYTLKVKVYTPSPETGLIASFLNGSNASTSEKHLNTTDSVATDLGGGWYEYTTTMQAQSGYNKLIFIIGRNTFFAALCN